MLNKWDIRNIVFVSEILFIFGILINVVFNCFYDKIILIVWTLFLLLGIKFIQKKFKFRLSFFLEFGLNILIIASNILGEVLAFYNIISWWDIFVHTLNSVLITVLIFAVFILVREKEKILNFKPIIMILLAILISLSIGVLWEFGEFFYDKWCKSDGQKDTIINTVISLKFDGSRNNKPIIVENIAKTVLYNYNDEVIATISGGYLDIGLNDTMSDLLYDFGGSVLAGGGILLYLRRNSFNNFKQKMGFMVSF